MNILVAEDDHVCRETLRSYIESDKGYHVTVAADGEEAWAQLCKSGQSFDVGIFDIQMPKLDGFRLIERMRSTPALRHIPAILCSAASDRTTVTKASALSVVHYIIKPYSKRVILEKLQTVRAEMIRLGTDHPHAVLARIGVDRQTYRALIATLIEEMRSWIQRARTETEIGKFTILLERAAGLSAACKLLGLSRVAERFEMIEQTMAHHSSALEHAQFPLLFAQISPLFEALETDAEHASQQVRGD